MACDYDVILIRGDMNRLANEQIEHNMTRDTDLDEWTGRA